VEQLRVEASVHAKRLSGAERKKRREIEKENRRGKKDLKNEMEETVKDQVVAYEAKNRQLEDEISTMKMELSYMKNEAVNAREDHENALQYSQYRSRTDAEQISGDEIARLKEEVTRREMKFEAMEKEMREKLEESKRALLSQAGVTENSYRSRIEELGKEAKESEDRRREQERKAKQVLTEEVAKLRRNHEEAVDNFRKQTGEVKERSNR